MVRGKDRIRRSVKHCFATQFLNDPGIEVFRGSEQILKPVGKLFDIKLPRTAYYVGEQFVVQGETKNITSYEVLREMGFVIASRKVSQRERWDPGQAVVYELRKVSETADALAAMPGGKFPHYVEHDPYNQVLRLIGSRAGPNGFGPWLETENRTVKRDYGGMQLGYTGYGKNPDEIVDNQMRAWLDIEEDPEPIEIKEAAFLVTEANEIVCFPNIPDMPSILISGMKGVGKSYALHSLTSRFFWKPSFDYKIVILNDSSRETGTWCLPNQDGPQNMTLKKLNERPLPLPTVYLHPKVKEDYETLYLDSTGFFITIPFKEIVENHKSYLKIEGSARYFTRFKEQLKNCNTQQEAEALLDTIQIAFQVPNATANKIMAEFDTLFDTKMTDISSKKQDPWSVSTAPDKYYNPLTACLHAGLLPVLETEFVSNYRSLLSIYFTYFVSDLFMRQKQDPDFLKQRSRLLLVVDECHNIAAKSYKSGADFLLRRCVREGRPRRIGTLLATQKFGELPDVIKDNSMYLLCFKNPGEAAAITNQYKMGKGVAQIITDLDKFECVAYTTEHFIIYDSYGNRRKSRPNEVFKGRVLPPFSQHKAPQAKGN